MRNFFSELLSDKKGGMIFTCFGGWHLLFIFAFCVIAVVACLHLKNRNSDDRKKTIDWFVHFAFGLYIADFFLMPLAYGEIDIEKLPFHVCTAMCVMCFLSRHNSRLSKLRLPLATLGFVSNLVYLIYPAGVMWHQVHPLSYRVIQTLLFHGMMTVYGVLVLGFESSEFEWKHFVRDIIVIISMTFWALVGNTVYNSETRVYNWFFVVQDPFYMFDKGTARIVMPFLNIVLFSIAEMLVYWAVTKIKAKQTASVR